MCVHKNFMCVSVSVSIMFYTSLMTSNTKYISLSMPVIKILNEQKLFANTFK